MKIFLLFALIFSSLVADELSWVDEQVNAIKPNRNGVSNAQISRLRNPFIFLKKNRPESEKTSALNKVSARSTTSRHSSSRKSSTRSTKRVSSIHTNHGELFLSVIINSAALIDDEWYKLGDSFEGYKITKVARTSVSLKKNNRITVLTTKSDSDKLKFK